MSFAAAQIAIENRFASNFTACPVRYQNVQYDAKPDTIFCDFQVVETFSQRADIGTANRLHRSFGIISANIHLPLGIGTNRGRVKADTAGAIFRDQQFSGITCRSPLVQNLGEREGWYVVNMNCEFYHDETYA